MHCDVNDSAVLMETKPGEMSEWLKEHAWKACIRQSRIGGSNPPLTARFYKEAALSCFFLFLGQTNLAPVRYPAPAPALHH